MSTLSNIEKEIADKKAELEALENKAKYFAEQQKYFPERVLAEELHGMLCHWNHTDGCSWHYEIENGVHNWTGNAHSNYLSKAKILSDKCGTLGVGVNKALEIARMVNALK
jgi:hypothetical protein